jgi:hypothetical protein
VIALKQKRAENANKQHRAKSAEGQPVALHKPNGQPTVTEKLAKDTGIDERSVHRRHATGQKLAMRLGVSVPSLEQATHEQLIEGGQAAAMAAQEKKDKAKETGKPEVKVDPINRQKPSISQLKLDVVDLPNQLCDWARRRYGEHRLSLEVMKATHQKWGELIEEFSQVRD